MSGWRRVVEMGKVWPMRSRLSKIFTCTLLTLSLLVTSVPARTYAQDRASRAEEIEWTWEVRPAHVDSKLPNVLLVGDSITRNYYPEVQRQLNQVANVYLMATSASVGDPRLPRQLAEFSAAESVSFKVVHFNNGMHGWNYSEADYRTAFSVVSRGTARYGSGRLFHMGNHHSSKSRRSAWSDERTRRRQEQYRPDFYQECWHPHR